MKYLHYFNTESEHNAIYKDWGDSYKELWVSLINGGGIYYNHPDYIPVPSGYAYLKTGILKVSNFNSEILYGSTYYSEYDWFNGLCFMYNNNIYTIGESYDDHHEFAALTVHGLSSGTYQGIFLRNKNV